MEKQVIPVGGMHCGHCEIAVQDAVRKLPGIKKIKASKRKKQAIIEFDADLVSIAEIKQAILGIGYEA